MNKYKNSMISIALCGALLALLISPMDVFAETHECNEHSIITNGIEAEMSAEMASKPQIIVELESEEEFYSYPLDPEYRYIFVIEKPSKTRAVCYMCGRSAMGSVKIKEEYGIDSISCPIIGPAREGDLFTTWWEYNIERCTACGYKSDKWGIKYSYTVNCTNGFNPVGANYWVVVSNFDKNIHNVHQCLRYWTEGYREWDFQ